MSKNTGKITQSGELEHMNDEMLNYFLVGLKVAIRKTGMNQITFAEGVTTPENLSKVLNRRVGTTHEMREKLARRAGLEVAEVIIMGKEAVSAFDEAADHPPKQTAQPPIVQGVKETVYDLLRRVEVEYRKTKTALTFWRSCVESLPLAVCVINGQGTVIYQNQADRSLYQMDMKGRDICEACKEVEIIPHPCEDGCAIIDSKRIGEPTDYLVTIQGDEYRIMAYPFSFEEEWHTLVMALQTRRFSG